jgi:hypothetical protein
MTNVQGVAVDMGSADSQAVGANGQPTERQYKVSFEASEGEILQMAKEARLRNDNATAEAFEAKIGKRASVSMFAKHPVLTGMTIGVLSTVTIGTGVYLGRRWYKNRQAAKLQPLSRSRIRAVG